VAWFAQHTTLVATAGNADRLAGKFLESVEIQGANPDCRLMIVSKSPVNEDVVFFTEVWSSESAWERARRSARIAQWAQDMPLLVAEPPQSVRLDPLGGKGLS
jgi:quinol monooxygenase YgiN